MTPFFLEYSFFTPEYPSIVLYFSLPQAWSHLFLKRALVLMIQESHFKKKKKKTLVIYFEREEKGGRKRERETAM